MREVELGGQLRQHVITGGATVGTTPVAVSESDAEIKFGVRVKAASGNANSVWVGRHSKLTPGTVDETDGFELAAGDEVLVPASKASEVYAVSDAADQGVTFLAY